MLNYNPESLEEFIGQEKIKEDLSILIQHVKLTGEAFNHTIILGGAGYGKTTLAKIIANELNYKIKIYFGGTFSPYSLIEMFNLIRYSGEKTIIFIDEIHAMKYKLMEHLLLPMESFIYEEEEIPHWTLIAGTTDFGNVIAPLRSRFSNVYNLIDYSIENIGSLLKLYGCPDNLIKTIALRSRGIPRLARHIFERLKKEWIVESSYKHSIMNIELCNKVFERMGLDEYGLYPMDRRLLKFLYDSGAYIGCNDIHPCGVDNICIKLDVSKTDYLHLYEPYLVKMDFIRRLPKGRAITIKAMVKILKINLNSTNNNDDYYADLLL